MRSERLVLVALFGEQPVLGRQPGHARAQPDEQLVDGHGVEPEFRADLSLVARVLRTLVVVPVRWVWRVVVVPVGRVVGQVWRAVVVLPARWARVSVVEPVRSAGRRLSGAFGGRRG
ncbi:hypothetical protein B0I31_102137 [Saccharothrix carnea]|uniref:Uncharacterized protein n=1 Tax=Saccharothrix carnea TaxID=1280637 RepID=A0A2P8IFA4_SACCR|nr:hypothetical protein B0I31_102137 [Saccharothrix carnea]